MIFPVINLNGTHPDALTEQLLEAHFHVCQSITAMNAACPNGRDYPHGGIHEAARVHEQLTRGLILARDYLMAQAENVLDQQHAQSERRRGMEEYQMRAAE